MPRTPLTRLVACAFAGLALAFFSWNESTQAQRGQAQRTSGEAIKNLDALVSDLKDARKSLNSITDKRTRDRIELLISRSEVRAIEARDDFIGLLGVMAQSTAPRPMTDADFASALQQVKKEAFDQNRIALIKTLATHNRFTSKQARDLLKVFTFDPDRVNAALVLYPKVVDPGNFTQALEAFTFDSSRKDVMQKITPKAK